jgi:hypothetical protein
VAAAIRELIQRMSRANVLWGAHRIHGELLKLGIDVAPSTVGKYLCRTRRPPSQSWRPFLTNHIKQMASMDFFTVPTAYSEYCSSSSFSPMTDGVWCTLM